MNNIYFLFTRILVIFSAPLFYAIVLIAFGCYMHFWWLFAIGIFFLLALSCRPLYNWVEGKMFAGNLKKLTEGSHYGCAIVMGGFSCYDWDRNRIEFNDKADRLIETILLYKRGIVKKILITGDGSISQLHPFKDKNITEGNPETMIDFLETLGVNKNDVILELYARNTLENAKNVSELILLHNIPDHSLLMVTSAYHIKRALASFSHYGLYPDFYAVDLVKNTNKTLFHWLPDLEVPGKWQELVHQIIGTWIVKFMDVIRPFE